MYEEYFEQLDNLEEEYLVEMAVINPSLCKQKGIQIELEQRDEGPIPHLHVYLDKTRNPRNCAYVRLDKAEYAPHHKNGKRLTGKDKKDFIEIMSNVWKKEYIQSEISEEIKQATGYEAAVKTWIDTFGETVKFEYTEDGYPKMPDYSKI